MFENRKVSLSAEARADLRYAFDYYESKQLGVGKRFVDELIEALGFISDRPTSFPVVHQKVVRRAILRHFPYGVFFRDRDIHLEIFAIVDLRRHPREWKRRGRND